MNYIHRTQNRLRLVSRNEGKIKSYESCSDIRAWNHDTREQGYYLREWIKSDMPICVIPTNNLIGFLRIMTRRSRRKATPRCHPDCKSKVLLESINVSCFAMKECFKDDNAFDKYFEEEEFETCNWPCDRCLEVLKSIKMFWRIIIEKILNINIAKSQDFENKLSDKTSETFTIKSITESWQREMEHQALYVKNITPALSQVSNKRSNNWKTFDENKISLSKIPKPCKAENNLTVKLVREQNTKFKKHLETCNNKATDTISLTNPSVKRFQSKIICKKQSRCTSVKTKMVDASCDTCHLEKENDEIKAYKHNLNYLQDIFIHQENEMESLKRENKSLKIELQNFYKTGTWKSTFYPSTLMSCHESVTVIPTPFESCADDSKTTIPNSIDSEMVITMKNGVNECYRHISLLQILHKTNKPANDINCIVNRPHYCKENPVEILTSVQNTFKKLVKREIDVASRPKTTENKSDVNAFKVNICKSKGSCSATHLIR